MKAEARSPTESRERSFGLTVGSVCGLFAAYFVWRGRSTASGVSLAAGALLVALALTGPSALRVPSDLWWRFSQALGWVNSRVLLLAMFFLVLCPLGFARRLAGSDPLQLRRRNRAGWVPYPPRYRDKHHYRRMY